MKYKITYIAAVSISLSLSGTSENQTFDDNRYNDLINVRETEQSTETGNIYWVHKTQDEDKQNTTQLLTLQYVVKRIATCKKIPIEIEIEINLLTKSRPQYRRAYANNNYD